MTSRVAHEIRSHIARITLTRATAGNVIDHEFGKEFLAAARALEVAPDIRAVVIQAEGKNFCLGGDLKSIAAAGESVESYLHSLTADLHAAMLCLIALPAPVIVAVDGTAAGAGLGLVLAADLAIVTDRSRFVTAYVGVGLTPDAGCSFLLPRAVGYKRAMELFVTNRVLSAAEALAWGLVNQVVQHHILSAATNEMAQRIVSGPLSAFGGIKRLMGQAMPGLSAHFDRERSSIASHGGAEEGREGVQAFLNRRAPHFFKME